MKSISICFALSLLTSLANAGLTAAERTQTIDALCKEMQARYVVKVKAEEVSKLLQSNLKRGVYDKIEDGKQFAQALSVDINGICKDAHLKVRFREAALPLRKDSGEPSPEEIAEEAKFTKLINAGFEEVRRLQGNVGYIRFNGFFDPTEAARPIRAAMAFVENTDALIFDIRENGGGDPETVRQICSYLFDKETHLNSLLFREGDKTVTTDFKTQPVEGKKYLNKPIYVLVSKRTGSGAEEFAYNLQTQKRATILGESTWGGANPGGMVRLNDHFSAFIPVGMAKNPITGTNWEGTGVTPDVKVLPADSLALAQRMAVEKLLENAKGADKERLQSVLKELSGKVRNF